VIDLPFRPDRSSAAPVFRQLADMLRALIGAGRLAGGTKLPATRELATSLGLGRASVSQAYDELVREGWLTAHVGQGTFVAGRAPGPATPPRSGAAASRQFVWAGLFALRARLLSAPRGLAPRRDVPPIRFDFRGGRVDRASLPTDDLRRAFARAVARQLGDLAGPGDPRGWPPLRQEIARHLVSRGIACDPSDVLVVNGAQQAIDLAAHVLVDPGDTVVMEQPGYFGASMAFTASQANLVGVGVDAEGLRTDELARVLRARRVKLLYTTPAAQSPTGVVLSERRRRELLALADEHQVAILEDDYDSELRYQGPPVAALKTLDGAGQVIYAGTFSKVLFPGLRVGFVVAARPLREKMLLARWNADVSTAAISQAALATLLGNGALARHVRRVRKVYAERLRAMLDALERGMPSGTRWSEPSSGLTLWVTLPGGIDTEGAFRTAVEAGIAYTRGEVFHFDGRGQDSLDLSFASLPPARIADGIALLGEIVRKYVPRSARRAASRERAATPRAKGRSEPDAAILAER
jgi:GntR family transcriptional regulator / MocR family aminotransferase